MSQPSTSVEPDGFNDPSVVDGVKTEPNSQATTDADQPEQHEWDALRRRLAAKPYDPRGWTRLVEIAEELGDTEKIRTTYDSLLEVYPNTVRSLRSSLPIAHKANSGAPLGCSADRLPQPLSSTRTISCCGGSVQALPAHVTVGGFVSSLPRLRTVRTQGAIVF